MDRLTVTYSTHQPLICLKFSSSNFFFNCVILDKTCYVYDCSSDGKLRFPIESFISFNSIHMFPFYSFENFANIDLGRDCQMSSIMILLSLNSTVFNIFISFNKNSSSQVKASCSQVIFLLKTTTRQYLQNILYAAKYFTIFLNKVLTLNNLCVPFFSRVLFNNLE